ncbi:hypothetical protein Tco_0717759 [Tanacetum coccineum]
MWTMSNRLKPKPITYVKIHPNSKPAVLTMYRNNDKRNFDVHSPFKFGDFRINELDELGPIIENKKNSIVKDLMTSLGKRYERLKKIPEELGIYFIPILSKEEEGHMTLSSARDQGGPGGRSGNEEGLHEGSFHWYTAMVMLTCVGGSSCARCGLMIKLSIDGDLSFVGDYLIGSLSEQSLNELPSGCSS